VVAQLLQKGLVVMSEVDIVKYSWRPAELETESSGL
jgi:hypothetical protein